MASVPEVFIAWLEVLHLFAARSLCRTQLLIVSFVSCYPIKVVFVVIIFLALFHSYFPLKKLHCCLPLIYIL